MSSEAERFEWFREHLTYEWNMLQYSLRRMNETNSPSLDWNCFYESFGVHARTLYEFLTNEADSRSFKASDYTSSYRIAKSNLTKGAFEKINRQVFHLAKNRPAAAEDKFNSSGCRRLFELFGDEMARFIGKLPDKYQAAWAERCSSAGMSVSGSVPSATGHITSTSVFVSQISKLGGK